MEVKDYLIDYAARADKFLDSFFEKKVKEVREMDGESGPARNASGIAGAGGGVKTAVDMLTRYKKFSHGGKKLRGALIQFGYQLAGGKKSDVLPASTSLEIIHSFLLMHDDIMDKDVVRRGLPTIHKQYEKDLEKIGASDPYHFGISMGIDMGDLGSYLAMEVLLESKIPDSRKIKAASYLSRLLQRVAYGQALDVLYEQKKKVTEADVMEVHLQKTSVYTIGGPLKVGALLGGLSGARINAIEKFGEPVGIAFQLRDDELGLYSDQETLGKPIGGDIREGKNTILKIKAIGLAKGKDKKFLRGAYGNKDITAKDVERVKKITENCGALKYSQDLSFDLIAKGKKFIPKITTDPELRDLLAKAADFVITRNS